MTYDCITVNGITALHEVGRSWEQKFTMTLNYGIIIDFHALRDARTSTRCARLARSRAARSQHESEDCHDSKL